MKPDTIVLLIGLLMVFIGVFGGGFEIKEIKIPKVNKWSRLLGFVTGALLMIWSQDILTGILPPIFREREEIPEKSEDPVMPSDINKNDVKNDYNELEAAWNNPDIENALLLEEYTKLDTSELKQQLSLEKRNTITKRIESLQNSINAFKALEAMDTSATLTVIEKLNLWKNHNLERLSAKNEKEIGKYDEIIEKWASITSPDNFVTCRKVIDKNPKTKSKIFNKKNPVWVWTKINAPQKVEYLRLKWLDNKGKLLEELPKVKVTKSSGYRTFYKKTFNNAGKYEVRLYNSQNHLIGRQEFEVKQ